jgi:tetratricopeptide (TPR) repeat protein
MKPQARIHRGVRAASADDEALARAAAALNERNFAEAEHIARCILAKKPQHTEALQLLGAVLLGQKRPHEAIEPLEAAARAAPNPELETHLAIALREIKRPAEAQEWLYRAIARTPIFPRAFQELGDLLRTRRHYAEAETVLKRGLEAAPTVPQLSLLLGGIYLDRADPGNAKIAFARALALAPGEPDALFGFGIALQYEADFARAAERFRRVLAVDPARHRARMNLGYCLVELGQRDEGIACLRETMREAPHLYGAALRMLASAGRGRFWLRRGAAAAHLGLGSVR